PELQRAETSPVAIVNISVTAKEEPQEELPVLKKLIAELPKTNTKDIPSNSVIINPAPVSKTIAETKNLTPVITEDNKASDIAKNNISEKTIVKPAISNASENITTTNNTVKPIAEKTIMSAQPVAKSTTKTETVKSVPVQINTQPDTKKITVKTTTPVSTVATATTTVSKPETNPVALVSPAEERKITKQESLSATVTPEIKKPEVDVIAKAAIIGGRKSEFAQVVHFKSDSLELALYDNGVVDGDTVSVFMNGEVLMAKQGLKASAIKKTIHISPGNEDFTIVLYADNLGLYSPNTGLLVVHDGEDTYNLRFSSDFQKSSGIVFRRKK
ncbi:MAG TPA: hypothetical protein VN451_04110, partial [Chitinophagaceae bacterium]|nr:hypothetical protein [Chitinophagaceae bacterium]